MNLASFKMSPVLKGHLFFVPKKGDLLIQVWLYIHVIVQKQG